jgi:phasin family protein
MHYTGSRLGAGTSRQITSRSVWEKDSMMFKVEDIQNYGKEQFEGIQAIATAYGDYSKKSYEDTKSFVEKLSGVKSLDKAIEAQTEFAKSAYETFVAESQKIAGLYTDLAKQTFKPLEGIVAKFTPASSH